MHVDILQRRGFSRHYTAFIDSIKDYNSDDNDNDSVKQSNQVSKACRTARMPTETARRCDSMS